MTVAWDIDCEGNNFLTWDLYSVIKKNPGKFYYQEKWCAMYPGFSSSPSDLQKGWRWTFESTYSNLCNCRPSFIKLMAWTDCTESASLCSSVDHVLTVLIDFAMEFTALQWRHCMCVYMCLTPGFWLCCVPFLPNEYIHEIMNYWESTFINILRYKDLHHQQVSLTVPTPSVCISLSWLVC